MDTEASQPKEPADKIDEKTAAAKDQDDKKADKKKKKKSKKSKEHDGKKRKRDKKEHKKRSKYDNNFVFLGALCSPSTLFCSIHLRSTFVCACVKKQ